MTSFTEACERYKPFTPGRALVAALGVTTAPGHGLKGGGVLFGRVLSIGATDTRFQRPDGVITTRRHEQLTADWANADSDARSTGARLLNTPLPHRWQWTGWTVADHIAHEDRHPTPQPLVIVGCSATKRATRCIAAEMYDPSTYFRLTLAAARALVPADRIRILSGEHGLMPLWQELEPYERRLGDPGSVNAETVAAQAKAALLHIAGDVTILAGRDYRDLATHVWPQATSPLAGTRGIGDQQRILSRIATGDLPQAA